MSHLQFADDTLILIDGGHDYGHILKSLIHCFGNSLFGKEIRGIGLGGLVNRNQALLGKWLWIYPLEQHTLWATIICRIFDLIPTVGMPFIPLPFRTLVCGKALSNVPLFLPLTKLSLGCGSKIWF